MRASAFTCFLTVALALPAATGCGMATATEDSTTDESTSEAALTAASGPSPTVELQDVSSLFGGDSCAKTGANVRFTYKNLSLPWGTKITLHQGFSYTEYGYDPADGSGNRYPDRRIEWAAIRDTEMVSSGPWTWSTTPNFDYHSSPTPATPGESSTIVFAFKITMPNGTVAWDGAGRPGGFFSASYTYSPSNASCAAPAPFLPRAVSRQ